MHFPEKVCLEIMRDRKIRAEKDFCVVVDFFAEGFEIFGGNAGGVAKDIMVTDNAKHLGRLPSINIENWKQA